MSNDMLGRCVLVPVANPASVGPLLEHAAGLARPDGGQVRLVSVLQPAATQEERELASAGLANAGARARDALGVDAHGIVIEAGSTVDGVLAAIRRCRPSLVLMGWRGSSSTSNVFGGLIDSVVGRSSVPLAVVRLGSRQVRRILLPVSAEHLLPGGDRGLTFATELARRLAGSIDGPTTVLRTGPREMELPEHVVALGDRVHHDPRRTDQAVAAFSRAEDLVVAAVAPTVSGLRAATTHLAWAAPDATLLVAVDAGPPSERGLEDAVADAGTPAPPTTPGGLRPIRIVVTARLPDDRDVTPDDLDRVLRTAGATEHRMAWWPNGEARPHVRTTVTVVADGVNTAIAEVMTAVHDAPDFRGSEISYDVDHASDGANDGEVSTADHAAAPSGGVTSPR